MPSASPSSFCNPSARDWRHERNVDVVAFHRTLPSYRPTRLVELPTVAHELGVARLFVKEESSRLGLPAFKILGASYAIARALSAGLGRTDAAFGFRELRDRVSAETAPELVAATDGNHGRAVARMGALLGLRARIFVPPGLTDAALDGIREEGAVLIETGLPYDDTVQEAARVAEARGAMLVQDTSWPGYEDIPNWIVDGYTTLCGEADAQLREAGAVATTVVVPVGVGSLAQAVVGHYRRAGIASAPSVLSVEPECAPAVITSLRAGRPVEVGTGTTIMSGLNCGTVSSAAWPVLRAGLDAAVTVTDAAASAAMEALTDLGVDSGPCGAAALAAARMVAGQAQLRRDMALDEKSVVVLLSTEGLAANPRGVVR